VNQYAHDAEGRVCATLSSLTKTYTSYLYDSDGLRLAKSTVTPPNGTAFNSDLCSPLVNGYTIYEYYTVSPSGQQMQRFDSGGWER
jgi:hypothetical protein